MIKTVAGPRGGWKISRIRDVPARDLNSALELVGYEQWGEALSVICARIARDIRNDRPQPEFSSHEIRWGCARFTPPCRLRRDVRFREVNVAENDAFTVHVN